MKNFSALSLLLLVVSASSTAQIQNVSFGLLSGTGGNFNSFYGYGAGLSVTGDQNTFIGNNAGMNMFSGSQNTFLGYKAGFSTTSSNQNHFLGYQSGYNNSTGFLNHFEGFNSGYSNTTGSENQFIGLNSGYSNTLGGTNLFIGINAGRENTTASNNHFIGQRAGAKNTSGANNYFTGFQAGYNNTTGSNNYFSGFQSGFSNTTGSGNVFIGYKSGFSETSSNKLYIDNSETSTPLVYGDFGSDKVIINGSLGIGGTNPEGLQINSPLLQETSKGVDNIRIGILANTPRIVLDNAGYIPFEIDNASGSLRIYNPGIVRFLINPNGYVGINSSNPSYLLQVQNAYCDGNTWYNVSDKNLKENFTGIKKEESILDKVMELPIQYWNYKTDKANRHIGPTAQDFYKVFQLGTNDKAISTIDETGVALAAIQELNKETQALKELLQEQQQLIASLLQAKVESSEIVTQERGKGVKLYQNQPNPFQRDTKITMDIPEGVKVAMLYVYDLQGKPVQQLVIPGRGTTTAVIEGGKLTSGIYLYVLIADGNATGAKRMILTD